MRLANSPVRVPGAERCPLCASLWGRSGDTHLGVKLRFAPFARQLLGADCARAPRFVSHILQRADGGRPAWGSQRLVRRRRALVLPLGTHCWPVSLRPQATAMCSLTGTPGLAPPSLLDAMPFFPHGSLCVAMEPSARVEPRPHCPCRRPRAGGGAHLPGVLDTSFKGNCYRHLIKRRDCAPYSLSCSCFPQAGAFLPTSPPPPRQRRAQGLENALTWWQAPLAPSPPRLHQASPSPAALSPHHGQTARSCV